MAQTQSSFTRHARVRQQQRGVSDATVDLLAIYGESLHDKRGATLRFFTKWSQHEMASELGVQALQRCRKSPHVYLVEAGGVVLTVGHRYRRIRRK